jgi:predicted dithiol-disulfide oxidoreductase (DUF899 family)
VGSIWHPFTTRFVTARESAPPIDEISRGRGPSEQDYVFGGRGPDGTSVDVRLSHLFAPGKDALAIYNFMFPRDPSDDRPGPAAGRTAALPLSQAPCPSCTALLDQLDGMVPHSEPHMTFVVVAKTPLPTLLAFAEERGWRHLRLVSSAACSYNRDYFGETEDGHQRPMLNVFQRDGTTVRHFWGSELLFAPTDPDQDMRHVGTLEPMWNLFDFTRAGRPRADEQLQYDCCATT